MSVVGAGNDPLAFLRLGLLRNPFANVQPDELIDILPTPTWIASWVDVVLRTRRTRIRAESGRGKTCTAHFLMRELQSRGHSVSYHRVARGTSSWPHTLGSSAARFVFVDSIQRLSWREAWWHAPPLRDSQSWVFVGQSSVSARLATRNTTVLTPKPADGPEWLQVMHAHLRATTRTGMGARVSQLLEECPWAETLARWATAVEGNRYRLQRASYHAFDVRARRGTWHLDEALATSLNERRSEEQSASFR